MNTRHDPTIAWENATVFEAPTLVSIGDAESVVLGFPWVGHDHFGYAPPRFEFEEDKDEGGAPPAQAPPRETRAPTN